MQYEVIIIGGSYAGLSAAMALGRSLRQVLIIDSGLPCNRQTPHSHNFLTRDGERPAALAAIAHDQVARYATVHFLQDVVTDAAHTEGVFVVQTASGAEMTANKLLLATGITDQMPDIDGVADCWGISVIHCPYCHGYEVRGAPTAILANGDAAVHYAQLIGNLTNDLVILTNGPAMFTAAQRELLAACQVEVVEKKIQSLVHEDGRLSAVKFSDGQLLVRQALYHKPAFSQPGTIAQQLGCALSEQGYIQVNPMQETSVAGVYACGDDCSPMRAVAASVASGNMAGAAMNAALCQSTVAKLVTQYTKSLKPE